MNFHGHIAMGTKGRMGLVGARYTLAMPCRVAGTRNEQANVGVGCVSGIATTSGLDVTSCRNENPSITSCFPVVYLE
jgi:hypothetical protein